MRRCLWYSGSPIWWPDLRPLLPCGPAFAIRHSQRAPGIAIALPFDSLINPGREFAGEGIADILSLRPELPFALPFDSLINPGREFAVS